LNDKITGTDFHKGKPYPSITIRGEDMGDSAKPIKAQKKRQIIACPLCGERLSESPTGPNSHCPRCEFNLKLIESEEARQVDTTTPAHVPQLVYCLISGQIVGSGILLVVFLLFASPLYFGAPLLIALMHLLTMVAGGLFAYTLYRGKGISFIRVGLALLGLASLPIGVCSIAAALAIAPLQRRCVICEKQIKWASYLECPHCQVSMHRWGSCRTKRLQKLSATLDDETKIPYLEFVCPNCREYISPIRNWGGKVSD
jgi:predicted RNA-binding Zn-ribbon protein involved in translation (DUF1610 family)